jgi:hypothetical protein
VLAALGDRSITGLITNPLVAVRKVRGGAAGREYRFSTRVIEVGKETTLVIDWAAPDAFKTTSRKTADGWGNGSGMDTLRRVLLNADPNTATNHQPWPDDPRSVLAFKREAIKEEFAASYPAKGEEKEARKENTRKAFDWAVKEANKRNLIGYRTIDDVEWIWLGGKPQPAEEPKP